MYSNPTLFAQISNRESWVQIFEIWDDDTGDLVALLDPITGAPLYGITLQIMPQRPRAGDYNGFQSSAYYDGYSGNPIITATLDNYLEIVGIGTINLRIPKSIIQTLRAVTYDVFMTLYDEPADDGRQLLIGRLPVFYGGQNT